MESVVLSVLLALLNELDATPVGCNEHDLRSIDLSELDEVYYEVSVGLDSVWTPLNLGVFVNKHLGPVVVDEDGLQPGTLTRVALSSARESSLDLELSADCEFGLRNGAEWRV